MAHGFTLRTGHADDELVARKLAGAKSGCLVARVLRRERNAPNSELCANR